MDIAGALSVDHLTFLADGFWVTLYIAFISIVLSFIIGIRIRDIAVCQHSGCLEGCDRLY